MPAETIILPRNDVADDYMATAKYLAVLAYPDSKVERTKFCNACRAWWIKGKSENMHGKGVYKADILEFGRDSRMYNTINKASNIIENRFVAAKIAKLFMLHEIIPIQKFSIRSQLLWDAQKRAKMQKDEADTINSSMNRLWSKSLPVVHLALGLGNALDDMKPRDYEIYELLADLNWVWKAVAEAEKARRFLVMPLLSNRLGRKRIAANSRMRNKKPSSPRKPLVKESKTIQIIAAIPNVV